MKNFASFLLLFVVAFTAGCEIQISPTIDADSFDPPFGPQPAVTPQPVSPVPRPVCPDGECPIASAGRFVNSDGESTGNAFTTASDPSDPYTFRENPVVNIPHELRHWNYKGGSCVHASTESIFEWQGRSDWAAWWRETYSGGESYYGLTSKLEKNGVPYAATSDGDVAFIDECCRLRYGAVIFFYPNHSITLVHIDENYAMVLDNNRIDHYITIPRDKFIRAWQNYGGVAITPIVGSPCPPPMFIAQN